MRRCSPPANGAVSALATCLLLLLLLHLPRAEAQCQWDIETDWVAASNPFPGGQGPACIAAGAWSLEIDGVGPLPNYEPNYSSVLNLIAWEGNDPFATNEKLPAVVKNFNGSAAVFASQPALQIASGAVAMRASFGTQAPRVHWIAPAAATYNISFTLTPGDGLCTTGTGTVTHSRVPSSASTQTAGVSSTFGPVSLVVTLAAGEGYRVTLSAEAGCETWFLKFTVDQQSTPTTDPPTTQPPTTPPPATQLTGAPTSAPPTTPAVATSTAPTPRPPLVVSQDRFINGEWVCPPVVVFNGGSVIVNGTAIIVAGTVAQIALPSDSTQSVVLVTASDGVLGNFTDVQVTNAPTGCADFSAKQQSDGRTLSVLFTRSDSRCSKSRHTSALVIGLAVGIGGAVIVALVALFVFRRRAQRWARAAFRTRGDDDYIN